MGDFNGDGIADVLFVGVGSSSISLGKGDGTFLPLQSLAIGSGSPAFAVVADFNQDGKLDVAVSNFNGGNFTFGNTITVFLGNGDGTFQAGVDYPVGTHPLSIGTGDFNGDGKIDLVTTNTGDDTVSVLLGNGDGTFQAAVPSPAGSAPHSLAIADFNGDGKADLLVTNCTTNPLLAVFNCTDDNAFKDAVSVLLGVGDGTFAPPASFDAGLSPQALVVRDFNGDGKPDFVVTNAGDAVLQGHLFVRQDFGFSVFLGNGDGTFTRLHDYPLPQAAESVLTADFNGDGKLDLVFDANASPSFTTNRLFEALGNGDGTFGPPITYPAAPIRLVLFSAQDLNGDGLPDVIGFPPFEVFLNAGASARATTSLNLQNNSCCGLFSATVQVASSSADVPGGILTLIDNGVTVSDGANALPFTLNADSAGVNEQNLTPGTHQITVVYSGDDNHSGSATSLSLAATPGFDLGADQASLTLRQGGSGTVGLQMKSFLGFNSPVTFSCSGLPAGAACSFNPASITPTSAGAPATLTISTTGPQAANFSPFSGTFAVAAVLLFGLVFFAPPGRGRTKGLFVAIGVLVIGLGSGCGGGGNHTPPPPPVTVTPTGTSQVTINAASGSGTNAVTQSIQIKLTVTP